jgi:phosphoenolpyruvate carboxykinase (ATP)
MDIKKYSKMKYTTKMFLSRLWNGVRRSFSSQYCRDVLKENGILNEKAKLYYNLGYPEIRQREIENGEGVILKNGVFTVDTGEFTGRSPKDKYFVNREPSNKFIDWGKVNQPMYNETFEDLEKKVKDYYTNLDQIYIFDGYTAYGDEKTRKKIRFITHYAFQHHFVKNMFYSLSPKMAEEDKRPVDFTVINASNLKNKDWKKQGLNSENFVSIDLERKLGLIGGTSYTGENKKLAFTLYNYWMPIQKKLSLHCGASVNKKGESILFLGLSGTGKTSLSTIDGVNIIGDDEHIYYDGKVVNLENGNYAKCAKLSKENEPVIYDAIRENALLENIWVNDDMTPDYNNISKTENSRVSYPMTNVPDRIESGVYGNAKRMVFLTCDAYSILPRVSLLTHEQAVKYFLMGYTSKLAGTERGVKEPVPTFSACFGAAFMVHPPKVYAKLLEEEIKKNDLKVYLLNTGWHGGPESLGGKRVDMKITLEIARSIYDGDIDEAPTTFLSTLDGLRVPTKLRSLDEKTLIPWNSWKSQEVYHEKSKELMDMFGKEMKKYE